MKYILPIFALSVAMLAACQPSGTAKNEMEKFSGTPTPYPSPTPLATPIDPADIVQVDTSLDGDILTVNGDGLKKTLDCTKYNHVMINGNASVVTIKGACRKLTVNGDGTQITADAVMEFVFNGTDNKATYSRFPNGKRPTVTENQQGNVVEQAPAAAPKKLNEAKP
jgi:hypothetical protein